MKKYNILFIAFIIMVSCVKHDDELVKSSTSDTEEKVTTIEAFPGRMGNIKKGVFLGHNIEYAEIDDKKVLEGDIFIADNQLTPSSLSTQRTHGAGLATKAARWPYHVVYYTISSSLPNQARVQNAIAYYHRNTTIRFYLRTSQPNYVTFKPGSGCASHVGMIGGEQVIELAPGCNEGTVIHEIGHALGLFHEQSRLDRDNNVMIHYENIKPGMAHNFQTYRETAENGFDHSTFDFNSIMMYSSFSFSKNGKPTITLRDGETIYLTQSKDLSEGDLATLAYMYPRLYAIKNDGKLYGIDHWKGSFSSLSSNINWLGTECMTSVINSLYMVNKGSLYRTEINGGQATKLGSANWTGTVVLDFVSTSLYAFQNGSLYEVKLPAATRTLKGQIGQWNNLQAVTAFDGSLYVIRNSSLYRYNTATGIVTTIGTAGAFVGATHAVALYGVLFVMQGSTLHRVNLSTGAKLSVIGIPGNWSNVTEMISVAGFVFILKSGSLYKVDPLNNVTKLIGTAGAWAEMKAMASIL
jgi:hypothetical protein